MKASARVLFSIHSLTEMQLAQIIPQRSVTSGTVEVNMAGWLVTTYQFFSYKVVRVALMKTALLFFLFPLFSFTNAQWFWQNPNPPNYHIIHSLDSSVVGIGSESMVAKSTDGGLSWVRKNAGTYFLTYDSENSGSIIWILGHNGKLLKSHDGGESWSILYDFGSLIYDFTFSGLSGWACGTDKIYRSSNGGISWNQSFQSSSISFYLSSLFFFDSVQGWCAGQTNNLTTVLLRTLNGGTQWTETQLPYVPDFRKLLFISQLIGFGLGTDGSLSGNNGYIWKTTDGGLTWEIKWTGLLLSDIKFINASVGYACGPGGTLLKTTDGGSNWLIVATGTTKDLSSMSFLNTGLGFMTGNGIVLKTLDYGNNWDLLSEQTIFSIYSLGFANRDYGIGVGRGGKIIKTTNGGNSWNIDSYSAPVWSLESVSFPDSHNVWTCGWSGSLFHSSDGGDNWVQQSSGVSGPLRSIFFVNGTTGWSCGNNGIILKTTNGGNNWIQQSTATTATFFSLHFLDENYGWAAGYRSSGSTGFIMRTTNGGSTWENLNLTGYYPISSVFFLNQNLGWFTYNINSVSGGIFKTTDGGLNWISQLISPDYAVNDIYFRNSDSGWAVGTSGQIWKTVNGGSLWESEADDIYCGLYSIAGCETGEMWISGNGSVILSTTMGTPVELSSFSAAITGNKVILRWTTESEINNKGFHIERKDGDLPWRNIGFVEGNGTSSETNEYSFEDILLNAIKYSFRLKQIDYDGSFEYSKEIEVTFAADYSLSQNYPNPFNPSTTISYSIPEYSNVTIKVFDVLGNEIETLVDEEKTAGRYELQWNAAKLPSSVYFYRLQAGSFIETKKLILLK